MTPNICHRQKESQINSHGNPESEYPQRALDVSLTGDSGIVHKFPAIGTGDGERDQRMVLVTSEPDPIKAQLIGFDIQRKYKSEKVILSRPNIADTTRLLKNPTLDAESGT